MPYTAQLRALVAALEGRQEEARSVLASVDLGPLDGHQLFHLAEAFTMAGDSARGMDLVEMAVERNFCPYDFVAVYCTFLAPLRGTPEFERIRAKAARRVADFRTGA